MKNFSYQLYSSRNFPPLSDTLKMLAELGYTQVEGYGALYAELSDADGLKAELDSNGLRMPTGHFALDMIEGDAKRVIETARKLGIDCVFAPHLAADRRPSDSDGWRAFAKRLQEAGKPIRDAGLVFGWHNHDFEFRATPQGDLPQDMILDGGPELAVELDIAWVQKGGGDPLKAIEKYKDRLIAVHVKDIAPEGQCADEDGWADIGHGVMDWKRIMAALEKTSVEYFVMEHDNPNDHRRFASRSIEAARKF